MTTVEELTPKMFLNLFTDSTAVWQVQCSLREHQLAAETTIVDQGPYAKHCRSCYFQTKVELRRRSVYVRMQNDVLRLVGRLLPNYL